MGRSVMLRATHRPLALSLDAKHRALNRAARKFATDLQPKTSRSCASSARHPPGSSSSRDAGNHAAPDCFRGASWGPCGATSRFPRTGSLSWRRLCS
eukprot:1663603-Alexandrium_andersonii.AAC.1